MRLFLFAIFFLFAASPSSFAQDIQYERCMHDSEGTNSEWAECGYSYLERADLRLNMAWDAVYPLLDTDGKEALLDEQRLWIAFKESACRFWSVGDFGREGQVLHGPLCRGEILEQRIDFLQDLYAFLNP